MLEVQDHYFHLAKKQGYVARSVFKLQELDEKFKLFGPDVRTVIDIGCAPGSRLQYASCMLLKHHQQSKNKHTPILMGFDLKPVTIHLPFTHTFVQDITEHDVVKGLITKTLLEENNDKLNNQPKNNEGDNNNIDNEEHINIDLIISDMAPATLGDKATDALRSSHLIMQTLRMYEQLLSPTGKFAIKVFMGPGFDQLVQYCRNQRGASSIKIFKPKACRKESKETYIVKI